MSLPLAMILGGFVLLVLVGTLTPPAGTGGRRPRRRPAVTPTHRRAYRPRPARTRRAGEGS